ncbi:hypothetical protein VBD025_14715 [Virgibacillus flavescens]|uniref:hypothetical protein n=1 Tax=Virgibacillus flavescens TaxID=1611422 RepID=UPI003D337F3D
MKKLWFAIAIIFILFGCSNEASEPTVKGKTLSLEEQITSIMSENHLPKQEIIDYDINGNFIYVIFKNKHERRNSHNPDLVILKNNDGGLEWIAGPDDKTTGMGLEHAGVMVFGRDKGPSISIIMPEEDARDTKIKEIKVLGESAKAVTYVEHIMEGFSKQYMYWIAYTDEMPDSEDIEVIME